MTVLPTESSTLSLVDGVPPWLRQSLLDWLAPFLYRRDQSTGWVQEPDRTALKSLERTFRLPLDWAGGPSSALNHLVWQMDESHQFFLKVVGFFLANLTADRNRANAAGIQLGHILRQGGSAWEVSADGQRLERRVDSSTADRATTVMAARTRSSDHLKSAWTKLYGQSPDSGGSYRESVKAIEAAYDTVVLPKNPQATLGTILKAIRDAPNKWATALNPTSPLDPRLVVADLMELVWKSQWDRHGSSAADAPLSVSTKEAEAALHIAITLVHLSQAGLFKAA